MNQRSEVSGLIGKVDYENRTIGDVERQINKLKDSMEMVLDEKVYRQFVLSHLNSPARLYALTKYAERPLEKQRRKWAPDEIQKLLNQMQPCLRSMPTFRLLANKLFLSQNLFVGNKFKDVSIWILQVNQ